jgi:hypothetical protein
MVVCRGGISNTAQKRMCENFETREPAQGGDCEAKEPMPNNSRNINK